MLDIKRLAHARFIWNEFYKKYAALSPGISPERQALYTNSDVSEEFLQRIATEPDKFEKAAVQIQSMIRNLRARDTLIPINPNGNHRGDFINLLNRQKIKKSINQIKLDRLQKAIGQGKWDDEIFNDTTLPQLALSLFDQEKISQQQIYTILERHQTIKDYPEVAYFSILNKDGSFTMAAKKLLFPILKRHNFIKGLSDTELEEFRLMIATLPRSEQMFYVTESGKLKEKQTDRQLGHTLIGLDGLNHKDGLLYHLSAGARDALGLVTFGLNEYVRPMPRIGAMGINEIEHGVSRRARYAALHYPDSAPYGNIHDYKNVNDLEATAHDVYHSNVMSTIPENYLKALNRFVDIAREKTGIKWSIEIWDWVDCDYIYFFHRIGTTPDTSNPKLATRLFCDMLSYGNGTSSHTISRGGSLLREGELTPLGILIFIDMIDNRPEWNKLNINPDHLTGDFYFYYKLIEGIYDTYIHVDDDIQIKTLKCQAYIELAFRGSLHNFKTINDIIDANKDQLVEDMRFKKRKINKEDTYSNTIEFHWRDSKFHFKSLKQIVQNHYLKENVDRPSKTGEFYAKAILNYGYDTVRASIYADLMQQGKSDTEAQFIANPGLTTWVFNNIWQVALLSLTVVAIPFILAVGIVQVYQAQQHYEQLAANLTGVERENSITRIHPNSLFAHDSLTMDGQAHTEVLSY